MPNGIYPVPNFRDYDHRRTAPRRTRRRPLRLRLGVLLNRDRLDDQLARGADPTASVALELRAEQLLHSRAQLAASIEHVLASSRKRSVPFTAEVPLRRADVRDCANDLLALALRLRDGRPIDVEGAAMTARLLSDGASPLYLESDQSLRYTVRCARLALDPLGAATEDLPAAA